MSLLKSVIQEIAAAGSTGAGGMAAVPGSLFGGGVVDAKRQKRRRNRMLRRVMNLHGNRPMKEAEENTFDTSDVISKIDAAQKKAKANEDTVAFGLEDEDGNLVKVYVRSDQAEDFEKALANMLAGEDENDDDENTALEIAEVLFNLKDKYDIVDVEWPAIEGDEEEEQEVDVEDEDAEMTADTQADLDGEGEDLEGGEGGEGEDLEGEVADDEEDAKSALNQVIDMMKADAEAKEAEARAKEAEAKAKEAEYTAKAASAKVEQEEKVLDMEAYEKEKSDKQKEAKQLSRLAKFQHDQAKDAETTLSMEAEEDDEDEDENDREPWRTNDSEDEDKEISVEELATLIRRHLGAN